MINKFRNKLAKLWLLQNKTQVIRPNGKIVAYPYGDGPIEYRWQGGKIAAIKAEVLESEGISIVDEYFSFGTFKLKIIGFDEHRQCYLCERNNMEAKDVEPSWINSVIDQS